MEFTYKAYLDLINLVKSNGYMISDYDKYDNHEKSVILRHDVDMSLEKAKEFSEIENENGVSSTYFILLTSDFYNIFSKKSNELIKQIITDGNSIGLHFDETRYNCSTVSDIENKILEEKNILENYLEIEINSVSMHRPSKLVLDNDIQVEGLINTYAKEFFTDIKYVSDSRMNWRENVEDVIVSNTNNKIQLLTHAFWYNETNIPIKDIFIQHFKKTRRNEYNKFDDNIKLFDDIIKYSEIR